MPGRTLRPLTCVWPFIRLSDIAWRHSVRSTSNPLSAAKLANKLHTRHPLSSFPFCLFNLKVNYFCPSVCQPSGRLNLRYMPESNSWLNLRITMLGLSEMSIGLNSEHQSVVGWHLWKLLASFKIHASRAVCFTDVCSEWQTTFRWFDYLIVRVAVRFFEYWAASCKFRQQWCTALN